MCLAIPMKVVEIHGDTGEVETGGVRQEAGFQLLADVKIGDYVIVHAGFAIQKLDEAEALETLALFNELKKAN
ncbi:HypC/HybG/HupF family hydrogenase formation chaperone [bacterium]|nr:HypC/HybG/HupF family hydrogenase formation chaperone [bacterium]